MRSAAGTACCCAVLSCLIDWIVVPCFVSVVSRTSRSTPLPRVVSNDITFNKIIMCSVTVLYMCMCMDKRYIYVYILCIYTYS